MSEIKAELIKFLSGEGPAIFLMNAVAHHTQESPEFKQIQAHYEERKKLNTTSRSTEVEVVLTVGGVQVPFWETMNDTFRQISERLDTDSLKLAKEMIKDAGLSSTLYRLNLMASRAEAQMAERLRNAGYDLPDEN